MEQLPTPYPGGSGSGWCRPDRDFRFKGRPALTRHRVLGLDCLRPNHYALIGKVDAVLILAESSPSSIVRDFWNMAFTSFAKNRSPIAPRKPRHCAIWRKQLANAGCWLYEALRPNCDVMKRLIDEGLLGKLERFEFEQGGAGDWSPVSGYNLNRERAGGGVLMTNGCHFLDRMLYWFGYPSTVTYRDDSHGGVEANCSAVFTFDSGLTGLVTLSKTHSLSNRFRLIGERGRLEIDNAEHTKVTFFPALDSQFKHDISANGGQNGLTDTDYFRLQIEDFARAIRIRTRPRVAGRDGLDNLSFSSLNSVIRHARRWTNHGSLSRCPTGTWPSDIKPASGPVVCAPTSFLTESDPGTAAVLDQTGF